MFAAAVSVACVPRGATESSDGAVSVPVAKETPVPPDAGAGTKADPHPQAPTDAVADEGSEVGSASRLSHELRTGGWAVHWARDSASADGHGRVRMQIFEPEPQRDDCEASSFEQPVSAVGTIVSWSVGEYWDCSHAAHPGARRYFVARDLEKTARGLRDDSASIFRFFDRAEVERALAADPYLSRFRDAGPLGPCEFSLSGYAVRWAIWDRQPGGQVQVRLGLGHGCEAMRGNLTVIGLTLHPKPEVVGAIERAAQDGLLMRQLAPGAGAPDYDPQ